jgi:hypothetical protein
MDVVKRTENTLSTINLKPVANVEPVVRPAVAERASYRERPGLRHETKAVLQQLHANIQMIEDLNGRLSFVMGEIRSLIRR